MNKNGTIPQNVLLISSHRLPGMKASRGSLPVSLLHLAAALRQAGHRPTILDLSIVSVPHDIEPNVFYLSKACEAIDAVKPSIVGISCFTTMHFPVVRKLAMGIRAKEPNMVICLGGVHPTLYPYEILENCPEIDFIATGEGEDQIVSLANIIASGDFSCLTSIQALAYRNDENTIIINSRKNFLSDLDVLPMPAYDMVDFTNYFSDHSNWFNPKQKDIRLSVPIYTTRSCPFNCSFCSVNSLMGRQFRKRDPEKVVDEIEMLVRDFGQNYFSFSDDNVNLDKKHFIAICDGIVQRKLDIQLCIAQGLYLNAVDEDIVRAFVNAGGVTVSVPIESGNNFIRNKVIGKNLKDEKIYEVVTLFKKYNFFTVGFFIMGFPEDTIDTLNDTLSMIERLGLDVNNVGTLIPFPGTRIYQQASQNNLLLLDDTKIWNGDIFFDPSNKQDFFIKPYCLDIAELQRFRKIFDDLHFTSERARSLNVRSIK